MLDLTKDELRIYKQKLLALRLQLWGRNDYISYGALYAAADDAGASRMPIHMAEMGSQQYDRDFCVGLLEMNSELLDQVEYALEQLENGTYGICEECGKRIPRKRLNAIPYANLCIKCAQLNECGIGAGSI